MLYAVLFYSSTEMNSLTMTVYIHTWNVFFVAISSFLPSFLLCSPQVEDHYSVGDEDVLEIMEDDDEVPVYTGSFDFSGF